jgi:MoxR-like ATPase
MVPHDTQYLFVDEATRKRQKALATLLDITAKSRVHTKDGWRTMEHYEGGIFAANPNERGMTTERLLPALADRMQFGVILAREDNWDDMLDAVIDDEFEPSPEDITPVLTLAKLHVAQYAVREVVVDPGLKLFIKEISKSAARTFQKPITDHSGDIVMGAHIMSPVRFARHLMFNSMANAISRGAVKAEMRDVQDGLSSKTHGLMTANGVSFEEPIHETTDRILDGAKNNVQLVVANRKAMLNSQKEASSAPILQSVK